MNWIVLDLEMNCPMPRQPAVCLEETQLGQEIISIGAVRWSPNAPLPEIEDSAQAFRGLVQPSYYRRINPRVAELTGLEKKDLAEQPRFPQRYEEFLHWITGNEPLDPTAWGIMSWSASDPALLAQQLAFTKLSLPMPLWTLDVQALYACFVTGSTRLVSLSAALEQLGIEQTLPLHDALTDAYYTVRVLQEIMSRLGNQGQQILEEFSRRMDLSTRKQGKIRAQSMKLLGQTVTAKDWRCPLCDAVLLEPVNSANNQKELQPARIKPTPVAKVNLRVRTTMYCPEHGEIRLTGRYLQSPRVGPHFSYHLQRLHTGQRWWTQTVRDASGLDLPPLQHRQKEQKEIKEERSL